MKNSKYLQKGFTLIDVLLTVAIISLLSSVTFSHMSEARQKADDAKKITDTDQVKKAVLLSKDSKGTVPGALSVNRGEFYTESDTEYDQALGELVTDGYISEVPHSTSGNSYAYMITEDGESAIFVSGLNNEISNNVNNSCDFVSVSGFSSCTSYGTTPCEDLTYTESQTCFGADPYDAPFYYCYLDFDNNCQGISRDEGIIPSEACMDGFVIGDSCGSILGSPPTTVCDNPTNSICDGSLDNQYCGCIE